MWNVGKISERTRKLYYQLTGKLRGTEDEYRYSLGINGLNEVCFIDYNGELKDVKGNRAAQAAIKALLEKK